MKQIIISLVLCLFCVSTCYGFEWKGEYENIDYDKNPYFLEGSLSIKNKDSNTYIVNLKVNEINVKYPSECISKDYTGKLKNGNMNVYNKKNKPVFTIKPKGDSIEINVIPKTKGLFTNCISRDQPKPFVDEQLFQSFGEDMGGIIWVRK